MSLQKQVGIKVTTKADTKGLDQTAAAADKAGAAVGKLGATTGRTGAEMRKALADFDTAVKTNRQVAQSSSGAASGLGLIASGAKIAGGAIGAMATAAIVAGPALMEFAQQGLAIQGVFANLQFSLEPARRATHGLVDDMTLATTANQALMFGVVNNAQEFASLAEAAVKLGQKVNQGPQKSIEDLTIAIGRGSSKILDNLGIILKEEEAHRRYAVSLGKTVNALTEEEKAEAFRKEALKAVFKAAEDVTMATDSSAAALQRFNVELSNTKAAAFGAEDGGVSLATAIGRLDDRQRALIQTSRIYGADLEALKASLLAAGVRYSDLTDDVRVYGKVLDGVIRLEKQREEDDLRSGAKAKRDVANVRDAMLAVGKATQFATKVAEWRDMQILIAANESKSWSKRKPALEAEIQLREELLSMGVEEKDLKDLLSERDRLEIQGMRESTRELEKKTKARDFHWSKELTNLMRMHEAVKLMSRETGDTRDFSAGLNEARFAESFRQANEARVRAAAEMELAKSEAVLEARQMSLEMAAAQGLDPLSLAEGEAQAVQIQLDARERYINATMRGEERLMAMEDLHSRKRQVQHRLELARLKKEQTTQQMVGDSVVDVHAGVAAAAIQGAFASDMSVKAAVASFAKAKAIEMTILAATEGIKAIAAAASFNFVSAQAHGTAAAMAAAQAGVLFGLAGATGAFSGGGGGGRNRALGNGGSLGGRDRPSSQSNAGAPPISRTNPAPQPLPPTTGSSDRAPTNITVINQSLLPQNVDEQMIQLRRLMARSERDNPGPV